VRGLLRAHDPELAAAHFNWLVMAAPVNRDPHRTRAGPLREDGVRAFLAAYGRR
jgi:hypothetical protein